MDREANRFVELFQALVRKADSNVFFTYTRMLQNGIELPIGPYNDIEEEEEDGGGSTPRFKGGDTPKYGGGDTPPLSDGEIDEDDFKVYEDEMYDETIIQDYVISPGYKVLFATLGGRFDTTYQRIRNENVLVKNIPVTNFMYKVGSKVDAIRLTRVFDDRRSKTKIVPDVKQYPYMTYRFKDRQPTYALRRDENNNQNFIDDTLRCIDEIQYMLYRYKYRGYSMLQKDNDFTRNARGINDTSAYKNYKTNLIWVGDGVCTGKSGYVYYWKPIFDNKKPVFVLGEAKIDKQRDNVHLFAEQIKNLQVHAQRLSDWSRLWPNEQKNYHKSVMADVRRYVNKHYTRKKRRWQENDARGSKRGKTMLKM